MELPKEKPIFSTSQVSSLTGLHYQSLRLYDREGLVPVRRKGRRNRAYTAADVDRILAIKRLTQEERLNFAGVRQVFRLKAEVEECTNRLQQSQNLKLLFECLLPETVERFAAAIRQALSRAMIQEGMRVLQGRLYELESQLQAGQIDQQDFKKQEAALLKQLEELRSQKDLTFVTTQAARIMRFTVPEVRVYLGLTLLREGISYDGAVAGFSRELINAALRKSRRHPKEAARLLGLSPRVLREKIQALGIQPEELETRIAVQVKAAS
jgi:DNA-binding transcriptional MerR regulator